MVGADLSTVFLPVAAEGNIRYLTQDICEPPADELRGKFDFTHVRNVLHSSGRSGVEKAVENLVGESCLTHGSLSQTKLCKTPLLPVDGCRPWRWT